MSVAARDKKRKQLAKRHTTELSAIYDTICETLSSQRADSNILDVYVLYDFVSVFLMQQDPDDESKLGPKSRHAATLLALCEVIRPEGEEIPPQQAVLPLLFDYDKLYYETNAIDVAMTTARCTQKQKAVLWPLILDCIDESQKKTTIGADATYIEHEYHGDHV